MSADDAPRSVREALERGGGPVAGRYLEGRTRRFLQDATGSLPIHALELAADEAPGHGDIVVGALRRDVEGWRVESCRVATRSRAEPGRALRELAERRPRLEKRMRILAAIRADLRDEGFLEVETPARVTNPGLEPHLRPFPAGSSPDGRPRWLATSPELHLKQLLAAGHPRIFELARVFRDDERGALHAPEFTLLEWYRAHAGLDTLGSDCERLIAVACEAAGIDPSAARPGCDLAAPFERATWRAKFVEHAGVAPDALPRGERERLFVERVEPRLGRPRPLLLSEYPADEAALARIVDASDHDGEVAARVELFADGIELANGFDELTDALEQRRRHEADRETRRRAGQPVPPLDLAFLEALEAGMPPAAGMALGIDRLVLLVLGRSDLRDVRAFP